MTPLALQAHLQAAREIVIDTNTFLYGDCPDAGCNCCLHATDYLGVVFAHSVLRITPTVKKSGRFKSGECGAHSGSVTPPTDESILESLPVIATIEY